MKTIRLIPPARKLTLAACLSMSLTFGGLAQNSTGSAVPIVTIQATSNRASWSGDPGVFTVFRTGNLEPALNVYCCIGGSASNGVDYQTIGNFVQLPSGVRSNTVVIKPINLGQTNIETVILDLCPSPTLNPVNYEIGSPASATVYITPSGITNLPPTVAIASPTNGAVFYTPANISLVAKASDRDGTVTNVEFFAGATDLGRGMPVVLDPPGVGGVVGLVYFLNWTNVATNIYALTAVATDNEGASTVSAPVDITVLAGPQTNTPPLVRIISPPNGSIYRAPVNIPIFAYAADPDGYVGTVEFFAGSNSLGFGAHVTAVPPPVPAGSVQPPIMIVVPTNYWDLVWTNPAPGTDIILTAEATDNGGAGTTSAPVTINILPSLPPPTNRPAIVSIVATDPIAIEGTNCWPWLGLANPSAAAWTDWLGPSPPMRSFTNCGPKNATFTVTRFGTTNNDLNIDYGIGGTASNGVDYVALSGSVIVPAGQRRAEVTIVPIDDGPPDVNKTVILSLTASTNLPPDYLPGIPRRAAAIILDSAGSRPVTGMLPDKCFHLVAAGPDAAWFCIQYSTNLADWTPVCTNQVVNGSIDFIDPDAPASQSRFYRAIPFTGLPSE